MNRAVLHTHTIIRVAFLLVEEFVPQPGRHTPDVEMQPTSNGVVCTLAEFS